MSIDCFETELKEEEEQSVVRSQGEDGGRVEIGNSELGTWNSELKNGKKRGGNFDRINRMNRIKNKISHCCPVNFFENRITH